ncbi:hypothetical protein GCM10010123_18420 [Pilimelia anulata]|uniref:Right handed beta helix domain-containing protein n=1 Tax=Pilimelia anulata TaxID=53371 RepID=A0A8J3B9C3_9ACTN|nr:right-handed parallel beta-helix repeat-containing protein [Pilimelia anulata]GGJ89172.1 hypothetical protein GCM10010123_18420 [Pilimelia anulata]
MSTERVLTTRMPPLAVAGAVTIALAATAVAVLAVLRPPPNGAAAPPPPRPAVPLADAAAAPAVPPAVTCPTPTVRVRGANRLAAALDRVRPGTSIALADGVYGGRFTLRAGGTAAAPVYLCGGPRAVLDAGSRAAGEVLRLVDLAHVRLVGFTVRNGLRGLVLDGARRVVVQGLTVERTGETAIHLRRFASDNVVQGSTVRRAGLLRPYSGVGIRVGTPATHWCAVADCEPDAADRNVIQGNRVSATTAEAVEAHEGTTGGRIADNTFDGSRLAGTTADAWVDLKGNRWRVTDNRGRLSRGDGFQTHSPVDGWGTGNLFAGNAAQVDGPGWAFHFDPVLGNRVACDNTSTGARRGLANVACAAG